MITNLFSTFDPGSSILHLNWSIILLIPLILPVRLWASSNVISIPVTKVISIFKKEVRYTLNKSEKGTQLIILLLFSSILILNFIALYPQVFSVTAHLTVSLPLSILAWITIISFGWTKNINHILSHLLPQGTPSLLINFIVIIELTRNLIRPITLCVRLTANLIAGHLLISLLGSALMSIPALYLSITWVVPIILTVLERAVACIQAYVFITLVTLYTTEIK